MNIQIMLNLMHTVEQLRKRDGWNRRQLETYQAESLRRLREYACARSPFYQRFHNGLADRPLQELPVLTKQMVMEQFDELVTDRAIHLADVKAHVAKLGEQGNENGNEHGDDDPRFLGRYWVNATSVSSGRPGLFLFDRSEWTMALASFARSHEWAGLKISLTHRMKMASVASTAPWHMSARAGATLRSWWMPALRLAASEPVDNIVEQLNEWQPEMLVAYPSMARILAEEQLAGRLRIAPHLVFTSAEVLTDETRRRIQDAWGRQPFNQYAATETGEIAAECEQHTGLHLFEDLVITEVVDEHYRPVPPGEYGDRLLVTSLFNRTQPLIRYELTDSVRLAPPTLLCPCGRPFALVEGIQGRTEDLLRFPSIAGGEVAVQPLIFHRVLDLVPASGWRVVQEDDGLRVLLSGSAPDNAEQADQEGKALADALRHALTAQGAAVPPITVERVASIPRTANGKAPLIVSKVRGSATKVPARVPA